MARQQIDTLHGQDRILAKLDNFDMPGQQHAIAETVSKILQRVGGGPVTR